MRQDGKCRSCFDVTLVKGVPSSIMIAALHDLDAGVVAIARDAVDEAVFAIDAARPPAVERAL